MAWLEFALLGVSFAPLSIWAGVLRLPTFIILYHIFFTGRCANFVTNPVNFVSKGFVAVLRSFFYGL